MHGWILKSNKKKDETVFEWRIKICAQRQRRFLSPTIFNSISKMFYDRWNGRDISLGLSCFSCCAIRRSSRLPFHAGETGKNNLSIRLAFARAYRVGGLEFVQKPRPLPANGNEKKREKTIDISVNSCFFVGIFAHGYCYVLSRMRLRPGTRVFRTKTPWRTPPTLAYCYYYYYYFWIDTQNRRGYCVKE